jgi:hypothetical protein
MNILPKVSDPSKFQYQSHRNRKNNPKIHKETQKTPNSQNDVEQKKKKQC